ncbi:MAG: aminotransferase class V-fold PLP-dependent enzyme [Hyphomicrobiaceae bacterium]
MSTSARRSLVRCARPDRNARLRLLHKLASRAVGLDLAFPLATGRQGRRIYLDSTASTLMLDVVRDALDKYGPYYSNTHSLVHFGARISTAEYGWAHEMVLRFVNADPETYTSFFVGSGTTGGMNRVARTLAGLRPERDVVITTIMEHHSNDLPHRKHAKEVVHIPAAMGTQSAVDLSQLERALDRHRGRVNYVTVTGVSNVTGIINPVHDIAALAHRHGAMIVVDGAQMVAHLPVKMGGHSDPARDLDILVFSGHKVYAPGSPGAVVARKDLFSKLEPEEVGGGMVEDVWIDRYTATAMLPDREEAGTPNIPGAIGLAASLCALDTVGMDLVYEEECALIAHAMERLKVIEDVVIYGDGDFKRCERAGAVSFNIRGIHHALTAAVLNDYFGIAVRNECFCAHPYVREIITEMLAAEDDALSAEDLEALAELQRGMVRASLGLYTTEADIDALTAALDDISARRDFYAGQYEETGAGDFRHKTYRFEPQRYFSIEGAVGAWFGRPAAQ